MNLVYDKIYKEKTTSHKEEGEPFWQAIITPKIWTWSRIRVACSEKDGRFKGIFSVFVLAISFNVTLISVQTILYLISSWNVRSYLNATGCRTENDLIMQLKWYYFVKNLFQTTIRNLKSKRNFFKHPKRDVLRGTRQLSLNSRIVLKDCIYKNKYLASFYNWDICD